MSFEQTLQANSDQINAEDLITGSIIGHIIQVDVKDPKQQQPVSIWLQGYDRPYKPCKTMRKLIASGWGKDHKQFAGRSLVLYRDPDVNFGKQKGIGGIRISHLSHIPNDYDISLTISRGRRKTYHVQVLQVQQPTQQAQGEF